MPYVLGDPTQTIPEIHVGDDGTAFISTIYDQDESVVDLSVATSLVFRFESPSHVSTDKTASPYLGGTDGQMVYITDSSTFTSSGKWKYQAIITFAGGVWYTNVVEFTVYPNIDAP